MLGTKAASMSGARLSGGDDEYTATGRRKRKDTGARLCLLWRGCCGHAHACLMVLRLACHGVRCCCCCTPLRALLAGPRCPAPHHLHSLLSSPPSLPHTACPCRQAARAVAQLDRRRGAAVHRGTAAVRPRLEALRGARGQPRPPRVHQPRAGAWRWAGVEEQEEGGGCGGVAAADRAHRAVVPARSTGCPGTHACVLPLLPAMPPGPRRSTLSSCC